MRYLFTSILLSLISTAALAEPYLAVREGLSCGQCHTNDTGGGQRTAFGNIYSQQTLAVSGITAPGTAIWTGKLIDRISIGGNGRFSARQFELDNSAGSNLEFATDRVNLYGSIQLNDRVTLYVDQQVAPGGSLNREAWGRVTMGNWYAKGGKMFIPFGWRLEDDSALVRRATGTNMTNSDNGLEVGWGNNSWQYQLAVTNGTGGGAEVDSGKFVTSRAEWIGSSMRIGASAGNNDTALGERTLYGLFAGLQTGSIAWLFEWDRIEDQGFGQPDSDQDLALVEANVLLRKGHNLKLTYEAQFFSAIIDPDRSRTSVVWEYFPWAFTQFRAGYRSLNADASTFDEGEEIFAQAHFYF